MNKTLKKTLQAVVLGLISAGAVILLLPKISPNNSNGLFKNEIVSFHQAVKAASPAVVNIYSQISDSSLSSGFRLNLGSGVIMSANGYILTNKHVINDAYQITVYLQSGSRFNATLVGSDELTDLAVLKIDGDKLPTIPQNPKRVIQVGDVVLAIGNPYNLGQSVTQGIISATGRNTLSERFRQNFIQTDASISKGNSGGALINSAGELIGINTLSFKNSEEIAELSITDSDVIPEGLNFAIPIGLAKEVMDKIIKDGRVIRGYFGVSSELLYTGRQLGLGNNGVLITSVVENGPADKAGIQAGDLVLKINEVDALSPSQMMEYLANLKPQSLANVQILRQNKPLTFEVTIGEYPNATPEKR